MLLRHSCTVLVKITWLIREYLAFTSWKKDMGINVTTDNVFLQFKCHKWLEAFFLIQSLLMQLP